MTNILATITVTLATNWTTVSTTIPEPFKGNPVPAVMQYNTLNQIGEVFTNTVATINWKGEHRTCVLESIPMNPQPKLMRSVADIPEFLINGSSTATVTNLMIYLNKQ